MHDFPERSIVPARGSCALDVPSDSPATRAAGAEHIGRPPRGQRVATGVAQRRRKRQHRRPALFAHRATSGAIQQQTACGTGRGKNDRQECVGDRDHRANMT
jgi:hypothetical protein